MIIRFPFRIDAEIELRQHTASMIDLHFQLLQQEREYIGTWEDWAITATYAQQYDWLLGCEERYEHNRGFAGGIWYQVNLHTPAHFVGIISAHIEANGTAELSYWLAKDHTGNGVVSRVVQGVTAQLLPHPRIVQVQLVIAVDNSASRAVAERCGYQLDHIAKGHGIHQGKVIDRAIYSAQQHNWQSHNWQSFDTNQ